MIDRALITFRKGDSFSPYICLRQGGSRALSYLKNAVISFRMGEVCDVYQIAALFVAFLVFLGKVPGGGFEQSQKLACSVIYSIPPPIIGRQGLPRAPRDPI